MTQKQERSKMSDKDYKHTIRTENILKLLAVLRDVWLNNPDLRLCQLIGNCFPDCMDEYGLRDVDLYYLEDGVLQDRLTNTYL